MGREDNDLKSKEKLKDWIDQRIKVNQNFVSSSRKGSILFVALLSLLGVFSSWLWGGFLKYFVYSLHLVFMIWFFIAIWELIKKRRVKEELIQINWQEINWKVLIPFFYYIIKPMVTSLSLLFFLGIVVLSATKDLTLWLWILPLSSLIVIGRYEKVVETSVELMEGNLKIELRSLKDKMKAILIILIVILIFISLGYVFYKTIWVVYSMIIGDISQIFGIIPITFAILISFGALSEFLSFRDINTALANQNVQLYRIKMEIAEMDFETVERVQRDLQKWFFPTVDNFLVFFNYYYLSPTKFAFMVS